MPHTCLTCACLTLNNVCLKDSPDSIEQGFPFGCEMECWEEDWEE